MKTTIFLMMFFTGLFINPVTTPTSDSISGFVKDASTGNVIENVTVSLFRDGNFVSSVKTGASGAYVFLKLTPAKYLIKASKKGYTNWIGQAFELKKGDFKSISISLNSEIQLQQVVENDQETEYKKENNAMGAAMKTKCAESQAYFAAPSSYDMVEVEHNTEEYDKINENAFKESLTNPLSTFSADVDKASYSNVRRFLNQNQMPYKDAVRVEEMINYFEYNYPQPTNGDPFSINMEIGKCPWNEKHEIVMVGLQGENIAANKIPASNLVFLLDVSGSMGDVNKLPLLKQAFKILVGNLRDEDKVAIVVYAGAAGCVLSSTSGNKKETINAALEQLNSGGSTAGGEGIQLAYKIAKENYIVGGNNRVILATDGDFNVGASSDGEMTRLIEEKRKDGVFISILGFGMGNYKDSKMEKIADAGNGNYYYIDNIIEAKKVFGKELWGTLYTIAKDVKIQVEFNPSKVKAYRLIGYENRLLNKEDFNDDTKDAGEIGCGHTVTALYEIIPADSDESIKNTDPLEYQQTKVVKSGDIMTVKLRYKKPDEDISKLIVNKIKDSDRKVVNSNNYTFACAVSEFGMLLRESEFKANSSYASVLSLAKTSKGDDKEGYRSEFMKLVEIAELLKK